MYDFPILLHETSLNLISSNQTNTFLTVESRPSRLTFTIAQLWSSVAVLAGYVTHLLCTKQILISVLKTSQLPKHVTMG